MLESVLPKQYTQVQNVTAPATGGKGDVGEDQLPESWAYLGVLCQVSGGNNIGDFQKIEC